MGPERDTSRSYSSHDDEDDNDYCHETVSTTASIISRKKHTNMHTHIIIVKSEGGVSPFYSMLPVIH
jgi:hypothetical protein